MTLETKESSPLDYVFVKSSATRSTWDDFGSLPMSRKKAKARKRKTIDIIKGGLWNLNGNILKE